MNINIIIHAESIEKLETAIKELIKVEKEHPCTVANAEVRVG